MEDEASSSLEGKVLANLRVVDLKHELEKRGLSKSGSKKDLVKRLKQQLEFEKLCEEKKSGEFDRKLELDAATEQNEFVKQYLAQQQRRLEAQTQQKQGSEGEISNENQEEFGKDDESESEVEDSETDESSQISESTKTKGEIKVLVTEKSDPVVTLKNTSNGSAVKNLESNRPPSPVIVETVRPPSPVIVETVRPPSPVIVETVRPPSPVIVETVSPEPKCLDSNQTNEAEENQNNTQNLESAIEDNEAVKNIPLPSPDAGEEEIIQDSESVSENQKDNSEDIPSPSASVSIEEQTDNAALIGSPSQDRHSENTSHENHLVTDNEENSSNLAHSSDLIDQTNHVEPESDNLNTLNEDTKKESSENTTSQGCSSPKNLCKKDSVANMESSECSSMSKTKKVPYSLSDIQLPESPGHHLKSKDLNSDENCINTNSSSVVVEDQNSPSNLKVHSNGVSTVDKENSDEAQVSDNESKENVKSRVSPEKPRERKESVDSRQTDESSSGEESEKDDSQIKKSPKHEDSSSNVILDSKEETVSKETSSKERHKSTKHHHQSCESDKSSDSEKYKHRQTASKHKARVKHRKGNRQSRSQSSSSSSSRSSDSSPKRRHSKKSVITQKSKSSAENDESDQMPDKNIDEKADEQKAEDSLTESPSIPYGESPKKRLKIKRDNVVPEIKLSLTELSYVPRKVSLSNRKLNRKSSEDKSNEPKQKKSKWESFAACKKASNTISISTDSLKNWFPDFKLMSEPSSSMELEPDEPAVPVADEKISNIVHTDVSYRMDAGLKQDSVSQLEVEDSESQEPNFEDSTEQGPVSKIIFIQNLVRPFTLGQLKDLLKQNGNIVEEHFWIDKIKSKCFVMYETEKEATKAKNALHNARWPLSNPKILTVEFSNFEELELHKKGNEVPPKPVVETPAVEMPEEMEPRGASYSGDENKRKEREQRRREKDRSKGPMPPVREWDKDKVLQDSPERERVPREEKSRNSDRKEKKESKKRPNEDTPAKLLDDLFQKTKNPPCIYWLPLTEEQAKAKEEAKKMRKLEREKRNQQLKEQEEAERRNKRARSNRRSREKENRKSSTRSRSPVNRRR